MTAVRAPTEVAFELVHAGECVLTKPPSAADGAAALVEKMMAKTDVAAKLWAKKVRCVRATRMR